MRNILVTIKFNRGNKRIVRSKRSTNHSVGGLEGLVNRVSFNPFRCRLEFGEKKMLEWIRELKLFMKKLIL